jgi:hypothetical protein
LLLSNVFIAMAAPANDNLMVRAGAYRSY